MHTATVIDGVGTADVDCASSLAGGVATTDSMSSRRSAAGRSSRREQTSPKEGRAELGGDRIGDDSAGTTITVDRHPHGSDRLATQPDQDKGEGVAVEALDRPDREPEVDRHHFGREESELAVRRSRPRPSGHGVAEAREEPDELAHMCRSYERRSAVVAERRREGAASAADDCRTRAKGGG